MLVSETEPHYAAAQLTIYLIIPLLLVSVSYAFFLRKRNWHDRVAFLICFIWTVNIGIALYSDRVSEHWLTGECGNVFTAIWLLSYIACKRTVLLLQRKSDRELYVSIVLIFGSFALFILFSILYVILAEYADDMVYRFGLAK